ncbi:Alpha/Beta hydrolase protein [Delphinella strobiligena]|nr:Alpha/Beta hydrolase protein [Delphinella strobiligena]
MGGKSKRTFRINGLNAALSKEELDRIVNELNGHEERYKDCLPRISLAFLPDIDGPDLRKCSTVSGRSKRHKKNLLDRVDEYSEWPAAESTPKPLCKDRFGGMTVLHSPENANLDICFVHGLNGHAIDTFEKRVESSGPRTAKARKQPFHLWPMDLLGREKLRTSRVLSFDYESGFHDNNNTSGIEQWSSDILDNLHRIRSECKDRPIIFVGYSLGGIVARQAAADLWKNRDPAKFPNVPLRHCGFIFLGTPHSGSLQANNSRATVLALYVMGYRTAMLQLFNYFNKNLREN